MSVSTKRIFNMQAKFNPEISLGQIVVLAGFLVTLGIIELPRGTEVAVIKATVAKQEMVLDKLQQTQDRLAENQISTTRTLDKISLLLEQHMNQKK